MNNAKFQEILDGVPEKPPRSRLEPYRVLIEKLRRRGRTFREIVDILAKQCNLQVSLSTLHDFVSTHSRDQTKRKSRVGVVAVNASNRTSIGRSRNSMPARADEVQARILALKHRCVATVQPTEKLFHYDPDEPLHLPADVARKHSDG